jgi:hypothetical protein
VSLVFADWLVLTLAWTSSRYSNWLDDALWPMGAAFHPFGSSWMHWLARGRR